MMARKEIIVLLAAATLAGCLGRGLQPPGEEQIWLRTDGRSGRDNPALAAQFEADKATCTVAGRHRPRLHDGQGLYPCAEEPGRGDGSEVAGGEQLQLNGAN